MHSTLVQQKKEDSKPEEKDKNVQLSLKKPGRNHSISCILQLSNKTEKKIINLGTQNNVRGNLQCYFHKKRKEGKHLEGGEQANR